jgi:hypothetical protein
MHPRLACVVITVSVAAGGCHSLQHRWSPTPPPLPSPPLKEFDLSWTERDENGLPVNPKWGSQLSQPPVLPLSSDGDLCAPAPQTCTMQGKATFIDWAPTPSVCRFGVATHFLDAGPFAAHVGWLVATYTGAIRPSSPPISEDQDFNFIFLPDSDAGLTAKNSTDGGSRYIELELDSREVKDRFGLPFWKDFGRLSTEAACVDPALTAGECGRAEQEVERTWVRQGKLSRAVVVGLFGVDCEHGCKSELHPVYALAVETDVNPRHNEWAIFARNWGNGGLCSTSTHELEARRLTIRVPPPSESATPTVQSAGFAFSGDRVAAPIFQAPRSDGGLLVTFDLAAPARRGLEELVLAIDWNTDTATAASQAPAAAARRAQVAPPPSERVQPLFRYVNDFVNALPADQGVRSRTRAKLVTALKTTRLPGIVVVTDDQLDKAVKPSDPVAFGPKLDQTPRGTVTHADNREDKLWAILCEASREGHTPLPKYNGRDMTTFCQMK